LNASHIAAASHEPTRSDALEWWSPETVASRVGLSRTTVYRALLSGALAGRRSSGGRKARWLISPEAVREWVRGPIDSGHERSEDEAPVSGGACADCGHAGPEVRAAAGAVRCRPCALRAVQATLDGYASAGLLRMLDPLADGSPVYALAFADPRARGEAKEAAAAHGGPAAANEARA
jgi:excisionase family DNA binding protein